MHALSGTGQSESSEQTKFVCEVVRLATSFLRLSLSDRLCLQSEREIANIK